MRDLRTLAAAEVQAWVELKDLIGSSGLSRDEKIEIVTAAVHWCDAVLELVNESAIQGGAELTDAKAN